MDFNFNNENEPWEFSLDIDDFDLQLTPVVCSYSSTHIEPSPLTLNPVTIIPGPAGIVKLSSSTRVEPSSSTSNPVRIIPGPAGIVQRAKLLKENVFILDPDGALMSTQEYMQKVVKDMDIDNFLKKGKLKQIVAIVKSCSPNALGDLNMTLKDLSGILHGTINYKVLDVGSYGKDINVGAVMILANISVFTPKPSKRYLNITKRNVLRFFVRTQFLKVAVVNWLRQFSLPNAEINFSFKLSSFDFAVDITNDAEIHTFLNYLRPMLMIDAAHLKGLYKGTNLVAVVMDGNNQIVPIAFGICKGHPVIAMAVENEFHLAFHVVCCRHLMQNLSLKKRFILEICKAYTREDYATSMNILQIVQPDAYEKLCQAGAQRWSRAHCPLVRYNYMTSNNVESVNACSVIYRKEPMLKLAKTYRAMVQEWYYKRRQLATNMTYEITDWAANKVAKKRMKSVTWVVKGVNEYQYQVSDGLPCGHIIVITRFLGLTDCVQYVADWFKKPKYQGTYSESIHFLRNMQQWKFPHNIQKAIPPCMDNPQPGRPKNTNRIQSQGEEPRVIHCSICKQAGHKRDQCSQSFVVQPPVNIRTQNDQEIPQNNQPSFCNPTQHYDNTFHNINHYTSQQYSATTYPSQPYCETPYPSQPYDQHFTNTSQSYNGHHTESSQMYEQYNSQQYDAQHLDDLNTNGSNSWFNSFGF
uniref:Homologous recombination OB-fold protein OB-fold domain-containing protein n=1 Tax=Tanacetum cinerariifolium TaxID=118510 RepID=A0A699I1C7_TANCI|nr:hypothetical protein [Tanacetum cinerariifolium]